VSAGTARPAGKRSAGAPVSDTKCCINGCFKVLPVSEFGPHARSRDGLSPLCRICDLRRTQLAKHGLTGDDKAAIAEDQDGCAICGRADPGGKGWVVDHDHSCCAGDRSCAGCRRGVLCQWCNNALGYAYDNPTVLRRMADFLELGTRISQVRLAGAIPRRESNGNERTSRTNGAVW
jgi:hypothetical protein